MGRGGGEEIVIMQEIIIQDTLEAVGLLKSIRNWIVKSSVDHRVMYLDGNLVYKSVILDMIDILETRILTSSYWRSIESAPANQRVLVCSTQYPDDVDICEASKDEATGIWWTITDIILPYTPTHWMALPDAPKE